MTTSSLSDPAAANKIIAPALNVFARRAQRLELLAQDHTLEDWLCFLAKLSQAQHTSLQRLALLDLPDEAAIRQARAHQMPLVPAQGWPPPATWRAIARQFAMALDNAAPQPGEKQLQRLVSLADADLDKLAQRVLFTELYGEDAALLPFIGAALQVCWTQMAQRSAVSAQVSAATAGVCPFCGFLPVGGRLQTVGEVANLRYLTCALCATEWNVMRAKCVVCAASGKIGYRSLDGAATKQPASIRAETCDDCMSYIKTSVQEHGGGDIAVDDLASLALDILLDEAGYQRYGPNLLLAPG